MVVGADLGSIPCKCKPTNSRYGPAESYGKMRAPALPYSPTATFRILPNFSSTPNQGQFTGQAQGRF